MHEIHGQSRCAGSAPSVVDLNLGPDKETANLLLLMLAGDPKRVEILQLLIPMIERALGNADIRPRRGEIVSPEKHRGEYLRWRLRQDKLVTWLWNTYADRHGPGQHHWCDVLRDAFGEFGYGRNFTKPQKDEAEFLILILQCLPAMT